MLVRTHPGESRDDCCVRDGCASFCGRLDSSCRDEDCLSVEATQTGKRKRCTSEGSGGCAQQQARFDKDAIVYVHAKVSTSFEWGEVLWSGESPVLFEDEASFISEVRRAPRLCVWRCSEWGKTLDLKSELSGAFDFWASIVSSQGFVPRLEQCFPGETSVVNQLFKMHTQWKETCRVVYTPLKVSPYPWEHKRCWRGNLERTVLDSASSAVAPPPWMDDPIDLEEETEWLGSK